MPNIGNRTIAVCIQAREDAVNYYELLSQSETVDSDDHGECKYMYEVELSRLCELYKVEESNGRAPILLI